jgi:SAM-dependent methyltransferase
MIAQRPPGAAPAIRASAEAIPLRDDIADAAMAVLTVHHWNDLDAGISELRRVARRRIVILTPDPALTARFWLMDEYLPQLAATDPASAVPLDRLVALLTSVGRTTVRPVPVPHDCTDGFAGAFWRRPEAYLDPAFRAGMSLFAIADSAVVNAGVNRLAQDLDSGAWRRRHADLLALDELDTGLRLLVTDLVPAI